MSFVGVSEVLKHIVPTGWDQEIHLGPSTTVGETYEMVWASRRLRSGQEDVDKKGFQGWNLGWYFVKAEQWIHRPGIPRFQTQLQYLLQNTTSPSSIKWWVSLRAPFVLTFHNSFLIGFWKLPFRSVVGPVTFIILSCLVKKEFLILFLSYRWYTEAQKV